MQEARYPPGLLEGAWATTHRNRHLFVIDTLEYAGNFERAMCAAVTGVVDDTDSDARKEGKNYDGPDMEDLVGWENDDHGCPRCATCYPTPGYGNDGHGKVAPVVTDTDKKKYPYPANNSVAIYLEREPTFEEIAGMKVRAEDFAARSGPYRPPFKIIGYRLVTETVKVTSRPL